MLEHTLHHAESAEKEEVESGDLLAAIFQEPDSYAVALLREQGVSRLDVLNYISHGVSKLGAEPGGEGIRAPAGPAGDDGERGGRARPTRSRRSRPI